MNRVEFMAQLERLLYDLPDAERQDALYYYNDYFDEAGSENEGPVIQELGSPGKVAAIIRAGYKNGSSASNSGEYTESGYRDTQFDEKPNMPVSNRSGQKESAKENAENSAGQEADSRQQQSYESRQERRDQRQEWRQQAHPYQNDNWRADGHQRRGVGGWILIIIGIIFIAPILLGLGGGLLGLAGGLLGAVCALVFSGFAMAIGGVVGIVKGAFLMVASPGTGLVAVGGGLLMLAVGILTTLFFIWILFKAVPKLFRGIVNFFSRIFHHGRNRDGGGTHI